MLVVRYRRFSELGGLSGGRIVGRCRLTVNVENT